MRGKAHGPETVSRVIADLLLSSEKSQREIAEENGVSEGSVSMIKTRVLPVVFEEFEDIKKADIGQLVEGYLRQSLATLTVQLEHFADRSWLYTQSAGDLGVLHGILHDKAVRVLAAAQAANALPAADAGDDIPAGPLDSDEG